MNTADQPPSFTDFLNAVDCAKLLSKNMEIEFQAKSHEWTSEKAQQHFNARAVLIHAQSLLLNEAERLCSTPSL